MLRINYNPWYIILTIINELSHIPNLTVMIMYCFHNNNPIHFTIIKNLQMIDLKFAFQSMIDRSGFDRFDRSFSRIVWPLQETRKKCWFISLRHYVSSQASAHHINSIFSVKWHSFKISMVFLKANIWVSLPWFPDIVKDTVPISKTRFSAAHRSKGDGGASDWLCFREIGGILWQMFMAAHFC